MKRRIQEWLSLQTAKNPARMVLGSILLFNILLVLVSSFVISGLSLTGTEKMNFFEAAFTTITMILDAGCIQFVIADIGQAGVFISIFCLIVIMIGMISFTGAVIGYLTNIFSSFIDNASSGTRKLWISDHFVILNWNTRASEIINDLLYCKGRQTVVVLAETGKAEIEREVYDRIHDTVERENAALRAQLETLPIRSRAAQYRRERLKHNITLIVREGDVFSSKELDGISLKNAKTIIILGHDEKSASARLAQDEKTGRPRGNPLTVKALMQVSEIVSSAESKDHQRIVVEITDRWTEEIVERIIANREAAGKCKIVPVKANMILGQLLSQFSLMPELNLAYRELFSNKGAAFYSRPLPALEDEIPFIRDYLRRHACAVPLTVSLSDGKPYAFFMAGREEDITKESPESGDALTVDLNLDYRIEDKNVVIIGHNSNCREIMNGFQSFRNEWHYDEDGRDILQVTVIDDKKNLEKEDYYRDYPFVAEVFVGSVYDTERITNKVDTVSRANVEDTSILILSDDAVPPEAVDANVLSNLVFAQDNIRRRMQEQEFDPSSIDIIAEIIDPKHFDVVSSYSVRNVVISNRYISKMITQIGEKDALFDFYTDILTYDSADSQTFESKEVYIKKAAHFFRTLPPPCRVSQLIRAVFEASVAPRLTPEQVNPTLLLGIVKKTGEMILFEGDQTRQEIRIEESDKLIVFSNH